MAKAPISKCGFCHLPIELSQAEKDRLKEVGIWDSHVLVHRECYEKREEQAAAKLAELAGFTP